MKDLEIRGAGNLLGAEQSGHIEGVGFDLYMRMVGEAVADFRGRGHGGGGEVNRPPVDAALPADYIAHERLRLEAYRKIADAGRRAELASVEEELRTATVPSPRAASGLFAVAAPSRRDGRQGRDATAAAQGKYVRFGPLDLPDSAALRVRRIFPGTILKPAVRQILVPTPVAPGGGEAVSGLAALDWVRSVLDAALGAG